VGHALRRPSSIVTNLILVQDCLSRHPRSAFKQVLVVRTFVVLASSSTNIYLFIYLLIFTLTIKQKKFLKLLQLRQGKKCHIILHFLGTLQHRALGQAVNNIIKHYF
jgi:hypothetical protein